MNLKKLPNIGKVLAKRLGDIGISELGKLRKTGSKAAWLKIRLNDPTRAICVFAPWREQLMECDGIIFRNMLKNN